MRRTALVTGAASGLGALAAQRLAAAAWDVVAVDVDEAGLARTALRSPNIHVRACDVADAGAVAAVAAEAGPVHRVVHAAGTGPLGPGLAQPLPEVERVVRVDYLGTVHVVRATLPGMLERGRGELVLFSSLGAWVPSPRSSAHSAAKAAVNAYAESLWMEHGGEGVEIRCVCPSPSDGPMARTRPERRAAGGSAPAGTHPGAVLDAVERSLARAGELYVVPGALAQATVLAKRYAPGLLRAFLSRATAPR